MFKYTIGNGITIRFPGKPSEEIRAMLKANGFRWQPRAQEWFRGRVSGAADFLTALDRRMNPDRPDGACWCCGDARGFFRPEGPATPVYCDDCNKARLEQMANARRGRCDDDPIGVDRLWEDSCRDRCGL